MFHTFQLKQNPFHNWSSPNHLRVYSYGSSQPKPRLDLFAKSVNFVGISMTFPYLHWWLRNLLVTCAGTSSFLSCDMVETKALAADLQKMMKGSTCLKNSTHSNWSWLQEPPQPAGACSLETWTANALSSFTTIAWNQQVNNSFQN